MFQIKNKTIPALALCAVAAFGLYGCGSDNIVDNGKDKEGQEQELPKVVLEMRGQRVVQEVSKMQQNSTSFGLRTTISISSLTLALPKILR